MWGSNVLLNCEQKGPEHKANIRMPPNFLPSMPAVLYEPPVCLMRTGSTKAKLKKSTSQILKKITERSHLWPEEQFVWLSCFLKLRL